MKTPLPITGLGLVSRHRACQIAICDEAGCDELFTPTRLTMAPDLRGFSGKEISNALEALVRGQVLARVGVGSFVWVVMA